MYITLPPPKAHTTQWKIGQKDEREREREREGERERERKRTLFPGRAGALTVLSSEDEAPLNIMQKKSYSRHVPFNVKGESGKGDVKRKERTGEQPKRSCPQQRMKRTETFLC